MDLAKRTKRACRRTSDPKFLQHMLHGGMGDTTADAHAVAAGLLLPSMLNGTGSGGEGGGTGGTHITLFLSSSFLELRSNHRVTID